MKRREGVGQTLELGHWPAPAQCPACGWMALFRDPGGVWRCTSVECDAGAATWAELDGQFRRAAGLRLRRSFGRGR